jgi:hypothetical protein
LKSQQRGVVQQLMASSDPLIQQALADPANIGFVKSVLGLSDLVVPGEDSRNKQLREIEMLMHSAAIQVQAAGGAEQVVGEGKTPTLRQNREGWGTQLTSTPDNYNSTPDNYNPIPDTHYSTPDTYHLLPSLPVDLLFDNHAVELEECRRWANSDAGQIARIENPAGFANVRAHAEAHLRAIGLAYANSNAGPAPKPSAPGPQGKS